MEYPKVLVVSNNSFSKIDSNGRTLGNLFLGWPKVKLAQFCVSTEGPYWEVCENYYCISDKEMLSAFKHFKRAKGRIIEKKKDEGERVSTGVNGRLKTATTSLIRHFIWSCGRWKSKELLRWVDSFNPDAVLIQSGDTAFMLSIARRISRERSIPLLMFNTEGFCFFQKDWMRQDIWSCCSFPIYKYILRRETRRTMKRVVYAIHLNQFLKDDFDTAYGVPSEVVYTSSDFKRVEKGFNANNPQIVYLGNFGFNRPVSLQIVAKVLQSINPSFKIDVYGKPRTDYQKNILENSDGIVFHGQVSYEEVKGIMRKADILLHVEGLDEKVQESLRYGFSTKIADSLSSGIPFLLFSRPEIACAQYIRNTGAGWFASNEDELRQQLNMILTDNLDRAKHLSKAKDIAFVNHNAEKCRLKFQNAIIAAIKNNQN